jgi:uncharacterized protein (TIGR03086 family)
VSASPDRATAQPADLLSRSLARFDQLVRDVGPGDWGRPTPCSGWTVRDLVGHLTVEDLWAARLFAGDTIADVGRSLDGDQLGREPLARWAAASGAALGAAQRALARPDPSPVHLSFGDVPPAEYAMQLFADHLVHAWDLATALGRPPALDDGDVRAGLDWFTGQEEAYRSAGLIGARPDPGPGTDPGQDPLAHLLAAFGRTS